MVVRRPDHFRCFPNQEREAETLSAPSIKSASWSCASDLLSQVANLPPNPPPSKSGQLRMLPSPPASPAHQTTDSLKPSVMLNELGNLGDSIEPFTRLILGSGKSAVRLHCTLPTWSPSDICLDLHDLHELQSRLLMFIHDLLRSLRTSGIAASYCLEPSNSPLCLVCALPPGLDASTTTSAAFDVLKAAEVRKRKNVLLADMQGGPCLVIT